MKPVTILLYLFFSLPADQNPQACTAFCLNNGGQIVVAKNLDWSIDLGYIFVNMPGKQKTSLVKSGNNISWISKYGSITFNQFGKEFPLGGMNNRGLTVEELNVSPVKLIPDSSKSCLNEFQFVQFLLDNCSSVDEATAYLDNLELNFFLLPLHYFIADSYGNSAIIEFDGKKFNYYLSNETGFPILSNNHYLESLKYLKNFRGFGGDLPVLNRKGSNERFVSVANMILNYKKEASIDYSFRILDTVKQDDTQWSIVYDITNQKVYIRFHSCSKIKIIDFGKLYLSALKPGSGCDITDCAWSDENGFHIITQNDNSNLIHRVMNSLSREIELTGKIDMLSRMAEYGNQYLPPPEPLSNE